MPPEFRYRRTAEVVAALESEGYVLERCDEEPGGGNDLTEKVTFRNGSKVIIYHTGAVNPVGAEITRTEEILFDSGLLNQRKRKVQGHSDSVSFSRSTLGSQPTPSLRERFENHPVVFGSSLLLAGLVAGFGIRPHLESASRIDRPDAVPSCEVVGLDALESSYGARIRTLQKELVRLEARASDHSLISNYQRKYKDSADRIREDIAAEQSSYHTALATLAKKCE